MILVGITVLAVLIDTLVVARTSRMLGDEPPVDPNGVTTEKIVVDLSRRP